MISQKMHIFQKKLKHHELYTSNLFIEIQKQTLTCYLHVFDWRDWKSFTLHWGLKIEKNSTSNLKRQKDKKEWKNARKWQNGDFWI